MTYDTRYDTDAVGVAVESVKQIRHRLTKQIAAVIQAQKEYLAHGKQWSDGERGMEVARNRFHSWRFEPSVNAAGMQAQLNRMAQLQAAMLESQERMRNHWDQSHNKRASLQSALQTVSESIQYCNRRHDERLAAVTQAGTFVLDRVNLPSSTGYTNIEAEVHATAQQQSQIDQFKTVVTGALKTFAAGRKFAEELADAEALVQKYSAPQIKEPMRDSEEEIQRYLRQLEDFMVQRQRSHVLFSRLIKQRTEHDVAMRTALMQVQTAFLDASASGTIEGKIALQIKTVLCDYAVQTHSKVNSAGTTCAGWTLDEREQPEVTDADMQKLRRVNVLLHNLARAMARLNEANAGCERVNAEAEKAVSFTGIASNPDWQQCKQWWRDKEYELRSVAGNNFIRETRIKLAAETKTYLEEAKKRENIWIKRFLLSTPIDQPWCDELRALLNAGAWTQHNPGDMVPLAPTGVSTKFPLY